MKDFNLKVTVRNARLLSAIRKKHKSVAAFCRDYALSVSCVNGLITMRHTPTTSTGEWTKTALRVSDAIGSMPDALWPDHIKDSKVSQPTREIHMDLSDVAQLESRGDQVQQRQLLARWSKALTQREVRAVEAVLDGTTLRELGKDLGGVSVELSRQIQAKALRKMKNAARWDNVNSYAEAAE